MMAGSEEVSGWSRDCKSEYLETSSFQSSTAFVMGIETEAALVAGAGHLLSRRLTSFLKDIPSSFHTNCESESFLTTFCVNFIYHVQFLKRARLGRKYSKDMLSIKFRNKG